ncbi:hypothetical protein E4G67_02105 [Candidatus Bathyarchaeota archaeon]|nr:MAG: hypothetical protein E4G67_02105 [Candidatus Bathyarchaeota archaeon]
MDKVDYLTWSRKYDKAFGWQAQRERELGAKFRKNKSFIVADLAAIVDWKFKEDSEKKTRTLALVARNDEATVNRLSSQALSIPDCEDSYRMNCITLLEGVTPVIASIILTFFDPKQYCILDAYTWKALLGNPPPNMLSTLNYPKLLEAIRKTAAKQKLDVRVIDKALFKKGFDKAK